MALEQQVREKEQQKQQRRLGDGGDGDQPQRRSQSAPQHGEGAGELLSSVPGLERAATAATEMEEKIIAGRRRRFHQQSQDKYLKGLQEQIEEKKRLAQLEQEKQQSRRRRMLKSEVDDDPGIPRASCGDESAKKKDYTRSDSTLTLHGGEKNAKSIRVSNQDEAEAWKTPALKGDVAADPVAITKIVDFCEELKKQNEDVKKQLLEQHAVLTSLHSTFTVEADAKTVVARRDSVSKSQLKSRPARDAPTTLSLKKLQAKDFNSKPAVATPVILRPRPTRGETKIPLPPNRIGSSLRSAGADIVKGFPATQSQPEVHRAEAKIDNPTRFDEIPAEIKVVPPDSPNKGLPKEEDSQLCETKASSLDCTKSQEDKETAALKDQEETNKVISSAKKVFMECASAFVSTDDHHVIQTRRGDDEKPMDTESKFVHDWESRSIGDDLLESTSISILDGPSSLVSLDQSCTDLFH
ncbi:hypothetical protein V7S43_015851 [Phytophthora oleae]|uniref:Uncharacterized protein n=1 Tax=Phytophthora oleae TaxID=2107226 RepID=A0ABD3EXU6_9STRA